MLPKMFYFLYYTHKNLLILTERHIVSAAFSNKEIAGAKKWRNFESYCRQEKKKMQDGSWKTVKTLKYGQSTMDLGCVILVCI